VNSDKIVNNNEIITLANFLGIAIFKDSSNSEKNGNLTLCFINKVKNLEELVSQKSILITLLMDCKVGEKQYTRGQTVDIETSRFKAMIPQVGLSDPLIINERISVFFDDGNPRGYFRAHQVSSEALSSAIPNIYIVMIASDEEGVEINGTTYNGGEVVIRTIDHVQTLY